MKHLKLMSTIALALAVPAFADDDDRRGRNRRGNDRHEMRRSAPRGGYGYGPRVAPRPVVVVAPVYPVYVARPVYQAAPDPYANGLYGNSGYGAPAYPSDYPQDGYDPNYDDRDGLDYETYAPYAPPPPRQEVFMPAPGPGHVWVNGFWRWGGVRFAWSPGQWMRPPHARAGWSAGGWYPVNGRYGFRRGQWR